MINNNNFSQKQWVQWIQKSQQNNAADFDSFLQHNNMKIPYEIVRAAFNNQWISWIENSGKNNPKDFENWLIHEQKITIPCEIIKTIFIKFKEGRLQKFAPLKDTNVSISSTSIQNSLIGQALVPANVTSPSLEEFKKFYEEFEKKVSKLVSSLNEHEQIALCEFLSLIRRIRKYESITPELVQEKFNALSDTLKQDISLQQATIRAQDQISKNIIFIKSLAGTETSVKTQQKSEMSPQNGDQPIIKEQVGNATALEFISSINPTLFTELTALTEKEAEEFLNRGGSLNIITQEKINKRRINIRKEEQVITGCNSGVNRSQVAAAVIIKMGITVKGVLAGGDSAMNPEVDFHSFASPSEIGEEQYNSATNFTKAFGICKLNQIGAEKLASNLEGAQLVKVKKFYQDYIDKLDSPTHFITFGACGPSVIRRLLKREGSLKGFTITHCPWGDEIAHPPKDSGLEKCSIGSYERFATMLRECFSIS